VTELRRLLDAPSDDFAVALLRSANDDAPEARSLSKAAAALGVGALVGGGALGAATGAASASAAGSASGFGTAHAAAALGAPVALPQAAGITFAVLAKQAAIGMLAGVAVMGGYYTSVGLPGSRGQDPNAHVVADAPVSPRAAEHAPRAKLLEAAAAPAVEPVAQPEGVTARFDLVEQPPLAAAPAKRVLRAPSKAAAVVQAPASAARVAAAPAAKNGLAVEVALLDRARSALAAGDAVGSLSVLDEYARERRSGVLAPEAQFLKIQALERAGRTGAARALARDFIAKNPGSRRAASLEALVGPADARP
jgi:hypothetical protein